MLRPKLRSIYSCINSMGLTSSKSRQHFPTKQQATKNTGGGLSGIKSFQAISRRFSTKLAASSSRVCNPTVAVARYSNDGSRLREMMKRKTR